MCACVCVCVCVCKTATAASHVCACSLYRYLDHIDRGYDLLCENQNILYACNISSGLMWRILTLIIWARYCRYVTMSVNHV